MYQALYRKYRPTNLDEVVGQDIIVKTLKNAITTDKLSHAYLFSGPRGTGKTSIAKILAKTVNCASLKDYLPCLECGSCIQDQQRQNVDIIEIDAASNNGVDEIREIRSKVNLVPSFGKYKIYIIDEVHMLTTGAFNALLKTLEEPPSHVIFILATTEAHKIPSTILSRCQRFDFKKLSFKKIEERLSFIANKEGIEVEEGALEEISKFSDGGMRDAIGLLDQAIAYTTNKITKQDIYDINGTLSEELIQELVFSLIKKDLIATLALFNRYYDDGKSIIRIVEEIARYLKDVALFDLSKSEEEIEETTKERYNEVLSISSSTELIEVIESLNSGFSSIKGSSNPKLAIELYLIRNCKNSKEPPETVLSSKAYEEKKVVIEDKDTKKTVVKTENLDEDIKTIEKLKEIRVGNTLSKFLKAEISLAKKAIGQLEQKILDETNSSLVSILLDGDVKAASEENLIFVYKTEGSALFFNKNLLSIENLLSTICVKPYKLIAVSSISWEIIKDEFNNKKRKFEYVEEDPAMVKKISKKNKKVEKINDMFADIVEFE